MKKLAILFLILFIFHGIAVAENDLTELSFTELMELRDQVQREIISRPEWKEVTVPPGDYVVGVDVPAGIYTITLSGSYSGNIFVWGAALSDYNTAGGLRINTTLSSKNPVIARAALYGGNIVQLTTTAIFTPYSGLGF